MKKNKRETVLIHDKFKYVLHAIDRELLDVKFIVFSGGRASIKSTVGGLLANILSFKNKNRILYSRYTASSIEASTQLDFEDAMSMMNLEGSYRKSGYMYHNKFSGGLVYLKGLKSSSNSQDGNNKSLKDFNIWICDEVSDIPDVDTFRTMNLSIRDKKKKNYVILILNPSDKTHWFYKHFVLPSGIYHDLSHFVHINYTDVKRFLSDDFLKEAEETKKNIQGSMIMCF